MELEAITAELIKRALTSIRYGEELPPDIYQLDFIRGKSQAERAVAFKQFVYEYVSGRLNHHRSFYSINDNNPCNKDELKQKIGADFQPHDRLLEMWSALYFRYLYEFDISVQALQSATFMNARSLERAIKSGICKLRDEIRRQESLSHQMKHGAYLRSRLESPEYQILIGNEEMRRDIVRLLKHEDGPRFVSIEGIGGIGKTALARAIAEMMTNEAALHDLIWISARQERLTSDGQVERIAHSASTVEEIVNRLYLHFFNDQTSGKSLNEKLEPLAPILANTACLVVIDNLEAMADDYRVLFNSLYPLAGKTRFLLTSRASLRSFDFIVVQPVPELSREHSRTLIQSELARIGSQSMALEDYHFDQICQAIGGIPLALKLLAAQLATLPLSVCLADLQEPRQYRTPEAMFTYIYRRTWRLLSESARQLLFAIHDVASLEGDNFTWLRIMGEGSGLSSERVEDAVNELRRYSLLETYGDEPLYRLHRLTITFLKNEFASMENPL